MGLLPKNLGGGDGRWRVKGGLPMAYNLVEASANCTKTLLFFSAVAMNPHPTFV